MQIPTPETYLEEPAKPLVAELTESQKLLLDKIDKLLEKRLEQQRAPLVKWLKDVIAYALGNLKNL